MAESKNPSRTYIDTALSQRTDDMKIIFDEYLNYKGKQKEEVLGDDDAPFMGADQNFIDVVTDLYVDNKRVIKEKIDAAGKDKSKLKKAALDGLEDLVVNTLGQLRNHKEAEKQLKVYHGINKGDGFVDDEQKETHLMTMAAKALYLDRNQQAFLATYVDSIKKGKFKKAKKLSQNLIMQLPTKFYDAHISHLENQVNAHDEVYLGHVADLLENEGVYYDKPGSILKQGVEGLTAEYHGKKAAKKELDPGKQEDGVIISKEN